MNAPEYEEIGGIRFCRLAASREPVRFGFSWRFPVVAMASVGLLLLGAKLVVLQIEQGNFLAGRIFMWSIQGLLLLAVLAALVSSRRRAKPVEIKKVIPPAEFPDNSKMAFARILEADKTVLRAQGWLWIDGDLMRFRSEPFAFDLRVRDFGKGFDVQKLVSGKACRILTPKGVQVQKLEVSFLGESEGKPVFDPRGWEGMRSEFESWKLAAVSSTPSLFPPIRRGENYKVGRRVLVGSGIAFVAFFGLGLLIQFLFSEYLAQQNKLSFALALAGYPVIFLIAAYGQGFIYKSLNKKIDKLKASGKVEMAR